MDPIADPLFASEIKYNSANQFFLNFSSANQDIMNQNQPPNLNEDQIVKLIVENPDGFDVYANNANHQEDKAIDITNQEYEVSQEKSLDYNSSQNDNKYIVEPYDFNY